MSSPRVTVRWGGIGEKAFRINSDEKHIHSGQLTNTTANGRRNHPGRTETPSAIRENVVLVPRELLGVDGRRIDPDDEALVAFDDAPDGTGVRSRG